MKEGSKGAPMKGTDDSFEKKLGVAVAGLAVLALASITVFIGSLFGLDTAVSTKATLRCSLASSSLETKEGSFSKVGLLSCYDMLTYEFTKYSFFYVGEQMETLIGLSFMLTWLYYLCLVLAVVLLFLRLRYKFVKDTVATLFAGFAAGLSLLALIFAAEATGEGKLASRYDYSQTPSVRLTPLLPLFPLLLIIAVKHLDKILNPAIAVVSLRRWAEAVQQRLSRERP